MEEREGKKGEEEKSGGEKKREKRAVDFLRAITPPGEIFFQSASGRGMQLLPCRRQSTIGSQAHLCTLRSKSEPGGARQSQQRRSIRAASMEKAAAAAAAALLFFFFFFARAKKEAGPGFHSATLRCDHFDSLRETKESMWPSSTGRKMPATKRSPVLVVAQRKRKSHHRDRHRSTKRRRRPTRPSSFPYSALFFAIFFAAVPLTTRYSKPCSLCGKHGQKESWRGGETKRAIGMDERRRAAAAAPSFDQRLFVVVVVVVAWQAAQGTITAPQSDAAAHAEQRRARAKPCGERRTWRPKKKKEEKVVRKLIFDFFFLPRRSALSPFSPP